VGLQGYLIVSGILFSIGLIGVLVRRNAIVVFMCIELMMNAVALNLVAFSHYLSNVHGQVFVVFVVTVAAAEATVGLAIIIALYKKKRTVNVDEVNLLKW